MITKISVIHLRDCLQLADLTLDNRAASDLATTLMRTIASQLKAGNHVNLAGFGTLKTGTSKARVGRNPKHPEVAIAIPAKTRVKFKAHPSVTEYLNQPPIPTTTNEPSTPTSQTPVA